MAQVVGKMFNTLETRGKMRTAAEETNLSANSCEEDKMSAEFTCTFATALLPGFVLLDLLEREKSPESKTEHVFVQTRKSRSVHGESQVHYYNFADAYGYRPSLPVLLYLSRWDFVTHWNVLKVQPPEQKD